MTDAHNSSNVLERMVLAVERVRGRLLRATGALESGGVPYAVTGECASAAWVATVDPAAVRFAARVEVLLRRTDVDSAAAALAPVGLVRQCVAGKDFFFDGPDGRPRDAIRVVLSGERSAADDLMTAPAVEEVERPDSRFRALALEPLARLGLSRFRLNDRVDLRDLLDVGLIDQAWVRRFPTDLAARLQHLIDTPEG